MARTLITSRSGSNALPAPQSWPCRKARQSSSALSAALLPRFLHKARRPRHLHRPRQLGVSAVPRQGMNFLTAGKSVRLQTVASTTSTITQDRAPGLIPAPAWVVVEVVRLPYPRRCLQVTQAMGAAEADWVILPHLRSPCNRSWLPAKQSSLLGWTRMKSQIAPSVRPNFLWSSGNTTADAVVVWCVVRAAVKILSCPA